MEYEKCLVIELRKSGVVAEPQVPIHVDYYGEIVGSKTQGAKFKET